MFITKHLYTCYLLVLLCLFTRTWLLIYNYVPYNITKSGREIKYNRHGLLFARIKDLSWCSLPKFTQRKAKLPTLTLQRCRGGLAHWPRKRKVWMFESQSRKTQVVKTGSDSSTAKRSAIGVSVTGSRWWPLEKYENFSIGTINSKQTNKQTNITSFNNNVQWNLSHPI